MCLLVSMMYTPTPSCTLKTIFPLAKLWDLIFDGNYQQALNILQVLFGSSWDRDEMVILKLCFALIHTKSEYGSFVYSSASKSELSILDAVHNAGIRLATGAFCTSHFSNTYMELWEWPLSLWRDLLQLHSQAGSTSPSPTLLCSFLSICPLQAQDQH